jgi:transcriptional regulator with XRE-family HTH domain
MELGLELRRRRLALGLSQGAVGQPMSRAFLSSVEAGRLVPSLASLLIIARRLNTTASAILAAVDAELEDDVRSANPHQAPIAR